MTSTESTMHDLGSRAPDFSLPDNNGNTVSLNDFSTSKALLVAFICNHCPYVVRIADGFAAFAREYQSQGLAVVAINANDVKNYPNDSPDKMRHEVEQRGYVFPYLFDESQQTAKAYRAVCTPDFFLYDANRILVYRGRFDAARPGNEEPVNGNNLRAAVDRLLAGEPVSEIQIASMGCSIKWKSGNAPDD